MRYLYGLTWSGHDAATARGIGDAEVTSIEHGELAALASQVETSSLRAKRRDLLRHSDVLQAAFAGAPVLPFRFGTVLAGEDAVVDELLAPRYEELVALLQRFDGLGEMRVRARLEEPLVLAQIVAENPRIADLRKATLTAGAADPRRLELGEAVAAALAVRRQGAADEAVASLAAHARDVHVDEPGDELEVLRGSFLVERTTIERFERATAALLDRYAGLMRIDLVGPTPPHSFVSLSPRGA